MSLSKRNPARLVPPIVAGAATMFGLLSAMSVAATWLSAAPLIGDMIAFVPTMDPTVQGAARILARTGGGRTCVLDASTLRRSGGSFVVERPTDDGFIVHWAGARTADGAGDCGGSADLMLSSHDLDVLGNAAAAAPPDFARDPGA